MQLIKLILFLIVFLAPPVLAQSIRYTLQTPGNISLAVYDASGQLVRTLLSSQPQSAGAQRVEWDGKDDAGQPVTNPTQYSWKMLQNPGFRAEYLMTVGTTLPPGKEWWETALGNHQGPRTIALDETGIYLGAGVSENTCNGLKMTPDGRKRIWSAHQPGSFMGRYSMCLMNGWVYFLQQNGKVAAHPVNKPNGLHQSVPQDGVQGIVHDVHWPGTSRPGADVWKYPETQSMDMTGYRGNLIITYQHHNAVQWRNAKTGQVLATVQVKAPLGVATDPAGNALVISENSVLRINQKGNATPLISGLHSPYRIASHPVSGEIWIAEKGNSQQIKRFTADGMLRKTYGKAGGRSYGLYHPENFRSVEDIIPDLQGGFMIVESASPRRVAHFNRNGDLLREWYGGTHWIASASPEPDNPSVAWVGGNLWELMRLQLDYQRKTWKIHSVYKFSGLADTLIKDTFGGGNGDWHIRKRNGNTYLIRRNELEVLQVDEKNWRLKPLVAGSLWREVNKKPKAYLWTDQDGDGQVQESEYQHYNWGEWKWNALSLQAPDGFDYYRFSLHTGKIMVHKVQEWNAAGAPVYGDLRESREFVQASGFDGEKIYQNPPGYFARCAATGNLYFMVNAYETKWANTSFNKMFAYDRKGNLIWAAGKHVDRPDDNRRAKPAPGMVYTFKNNVGVVKEVVVATDFDGGWDGAHPAITYAWDKDGLFAGNLFGKTAPTTAPPWKYGHSSDNGTGAVCAEPATGEVLYFAGSENEIRVYRIRGWKGWVRQGGKVE